MDDGPSAAGELLHLETSCVTMLMSQVERVELHMQATTLHTSGLSQVVVSELMRKWGPEGFDAHVAMVCDLYEQRRDHFLQCANQHLSGLARWTEPSAGMFVWIECQGIQDATSLVRLFGPPAARM